MNKALTFSQGKISKKNKIKSEKVVLVMATGFEPTTTQFQNENSTIYP